MIKASVIVVTYNRAGLLKYCLKQLLNQSTDDYEILVIDDGSTDETPKMVSLLQNNNRLRYIRNEVQQGQPTVRNLGIREAKGEIIIFVDSDVMVAKRFVEDHIKPHLKNDRLIVQGLVRHIRHPKDIGKISFKIDGLSKALVTQNVSVKKKWLLEVGLMDERFKVTMGFEDTDLGKRLKAIGLKSVYGWKKCFAYHIDGYPTLEKFRTSFNKRYQWSKSIVYFGSKHGERFVKKNKVFFLTWLFQTHRWVEKEAALKMLVAGIDSPLLFVTPLLKEIMKYHYRAKGIREAEQEARGNTTN